MRALDSLLGSLRGCLERFPDKRGGMNTTYDIGDIGMAAFSVFFIQSPSFLAQQRQLEEGHGRSNCASLFGIAKIPSDNHIRDMLDPAAPALLRPVFAETGEQLRQIDGGLDLFRRLDGRVLIALDGTEYHCSRKVQCQHCSTRVRGNGGTEYYHSVLAATLVAPGHNNVIPLEPEFIVPQDGAEKQDCENMAAKRWLAAHAPRYAALDPVYLGDGLFSRQPLCQAVLDTGGHLIFVCKPSSHPLIQEYLTGADLPELLDGFGEHRTQQRRRSRIAHVADVVVGGDFGDTEKAGAVGAAVPFLELALMRQERRTLHEEQRDGRHADVADAVGRVHAAALVREPLQAPSQ
jgi:hypothetical protein